MEYEVGETVYEFPDDMAQDEVLRILTDKGIIEPPALPAEPIPELEVPAPDIPRPAELAAAREEAAQAAVAPVMQARQSLIREGRVFEEEAQALERERQAQQRRSTAVIQPGRDEPREVDPEGFAPFRPSRIIEREIPAVLPSGEILTERVFVEPSGEERPATAADETAEAFALQTVLGSQSARQLGENIRAQQADIDRRIAAGEDVGVFESAGPLLSGILTESGETAGIVETELGAALRSTLGWVSALAAEGYFRGLGYEVDANGVPVDPDDLGFAIAQGRRTLGIPEVFSPGEFLSGPARVALEQVSPELSESLRDLVKSVPQLAVPLPGVATQSQARKVTTYDPEGRRVVSVVEVPSPLEDFEGWKEAEQARIAQNVATGRTMGDEFLDAPAVRDWYASVWGDPDAAYWAGSLGEVFMPAGPGTAARGAAKGAQFVAGSKPASQAARLAIRAAEATAAAKPQGRASKAAQAAALSIANPIADIAAAITPGKASDGRVVRRVAQNVLQSGALDEATATAARQAIKASSDTVDEVLADVSPLLGDNADYFARQFRLNVPDDVVMVTTNVGVPRAHEAALRRSLGAFRRQVFTGRPSDVADKLPDAVGDQLRKFERWQDMPADLRQQATTLLEDAHAIDQAPKVARLARDMTAAQTFVTGQTRGLDLLLKSRRLQTPAARRAKAVLGGSRFLESETAAVARARADIRAAAQTEFARIGQRMADRARELGSADDAVDAVFTEEIARAPRPIGAQEAWKKVIGAMYGVDEGMAEQFFDLATRRGFVNEVATQMPTVATVRAVDQAFMKNNVRGLSGVRGTSKLTSWMAPDYQKALLKVALDEGTKKGLAARGRYTEQLGSAIEAVTAEAGQLPTGLDRFVAALTEPKGVVVPRLARGSVQRKRVYDVLQSHAERVLAENGEEFAEFIEGISPRARASLQSVILEMMDFALGRGRRNVVQNATYGYVVPNVIGFPAAIFKQALTPLLTVGLKESGDVLDRLIQRRTFGGGLTTQDGVYYTGKQLQELAEQTGLGYSTVSSERVGSLADDLLRDARRAAEGPLEGVVKQQLNPLDKSVYTRTAEAIEMSMRQAAFEAALIKGQAPRQAAETARRTFFDYSEVPGPIRESLGQFIATAAGNTKLYTELVQAIMTNPSKARVVLKAKLQQARAQDPYNIHGDKALKSLGLVNAGDGVFFGPEVPLFAAPEVALAMGRQGDLLLRELRRVSRGAETAGDLVEAVAEGTEVITRRLGDEALGAVYDAFDDFAGGQTYQTQGIGGAEPVSDEQMFWAAALYAHHTDQGRRTGAWDQFTDVFEPQTVEPPPELRYKDTEYWTKAPKGTPHLLWGRDERGLPLYKVIELSDTGERNMRIMRELTPDAIESALVGYTSAFELNPREEATPIAVYPGAALPSTAAEAAAGALLPRAPVADPQQARREDMQRIQQVMTGQ